MVRLQKAPGLAHGAAIPSQPTIMQEREHRGVRQFNVAR